MSTELHPGEVWFADLGIAAKNRPVLLLAVPIETDARELVIVAPLTSKIRGMRGEVDLAKPRWLPKPSAVNVQGIASFDPSKLVRRMGVLSNSQMDSVRSALKELLGL